MDVKLCYLVKVKTKTNQMSGSVILLLSVFSFPQAVLTSPNDCGDYIHIESEVRGLKVTGCMLVFVGKKEAE